MDPGHSSAESFHRLADLYREKFMDLTLYHDSYRIFCDHLPRPKSSVLDAACGPGNVARFLLGYRPDLEVLGLDLAPRMVELATSAVPGARFRHFDVRHLGRLEERFDGIVCAFGLPYLTTDSARTFIAEASERLLPGGVLYLSTVLGDPSASGVHRHSSGEEFHVTYHTETDLLATLERHGFRVVHRIHLASPIQASQVTTDLIVIATKAQDGATHDYSHNSVAELTQKCDLFQVIAPWWETFRRICTPGLLLGLAVAAAPSNRAADEDRTQPPSESLQIVSSPVIVDFRNFIPGIDPLQPVVDQPVFDEFGSRLAGPFYMAQLYRVPEVGGLAKATPVGSPRPFGTGADSGYWIPDADPQVRLTVSVGCCAVVQVRVWDSRAGTNFAQAAGGRRAVSKLLRFFRDGQVRTLPKLGLITLQDYEAPALTVTQPATATVWVQTGEYSGTPLSQPGFLGQLYLQTNINDAAFQSGRGGVPVGPVARVGHEAANAGRWEVDEHQIIPGIPVRPAKDDGAPENLFQVQFRVWDGAAGSNYEESLRTGGQVGFATATDWDSSRVFVAFPRLSSAPSTVHLQPVTMIPRKWPITVPPGMGLFSNPTTNHLGTSYAWDDLFSDLPSGLLIFQFDAELQSYQFAVRHRAWYANASSFFAPGEGFFLFNPSPQPVTLLFPGAHGPLRALSRPKGQARFECRGNTFGRSVSWLELTGLVPVEGDVLFRYRDGRWEVNSYSFGAWDRGEPQISANETVFLSVQP
ncbi:MAG: class I SAM-dependent methyltransferase [Verrucomicrobiales bacterium]|nr:class I SAM-dependent methyltransferase [Verrucomicrobiales bacterium]